MNSFHNVFIYMYFQFIAKTYHYYGCSSLNISVCSRVCIYMYVCMFVCVCYPDHIMLIFTKKLSYNVQMMKFEGFLL